MSCFFCFKQKTAYEMRISDWSSDVCSSDLLHRPNRCAAVAGHVDRRDHLDLARGGGLDDRDIVGGGEVSVDPARALGPRAELRPEARCLGRIVTAFRADLGEVWQRRDFAATTPIHG